LWLIDCELHRNVNTNHGGSEMHNEAALKHTHTPATNEAIGLDRSEVARLWEQQKSLRVKIAERCRDINFEHVRPVTHFELLSIYQVLTHQQTTRKAEVDAGLPPMLPRVYRSNSSDETGELLYKLLAKCFVFPQADDSMMRAEYPFIQQGAAVSIDPEAELRPGRMVLVIKRSGEVVLRQYDEAPRGVRLTPLNRDYEGLQLEAEDYIVGVAIASTSWWFAD
jgi:SOS-response transcriptional repressor LexA